MAAPDCHHWLEIIYGVNNLTYPPCFSWTSTTGTTPCFAVVAANAAMPTWPAAGTDPVWTPCKPGWSTSWPPVPRRCRHERLQLHPAAPASYQPEDVRHGPLPPAPAAPSGP